MKPLLSRLKLLRASVRAIQADIDDKSGSTTVIFALTLVVLSGAAGAGVDYGRFVTAKRDVQLALDSAALAGVSALGDAKDLSGKSGSLTKPARLLIAKKYFNANVGSVQVDSIDFRYEREHLVGEAKFKLDTTLLKVLGINSLHAAGRSEATSEPVRVPICFMAMHPTRKHTLELKDSVSVKGPECHIYGNSDHFDDVVDPHTPENFLVGKSVQAVGFGHHYIVNVTPPLEHAPELIADPLATLSIPTAGACQYTNVVVNGGSRTLSPGTYCGGLTIKNRAAVKFSAGLYIISGGKLNIENSEVTGERVTISLSNKSATLNWTGSKIILSAPKSGDYQGMVLIGVREPTAHTFLYSMIDLHGLVYLPNGDVTWVHADTPALSAKWTAWIVDGVSWRGEGTINLNFNLADSDIPYPSALNVIPRPGEPRLVL